jgi:predicted phosphodiesterase
MRLALLADVHANLPALTRVLDLLASDEVDAYLCAGDLVGYGPHPNECVNAIEALGAICVAGNHDLIATGRLPAERIGALARTSLRWTARELRPGTAAFIGRLPRTTRSGGVLVAHGSLDDPTTYVTSDHAPGQLGRLRAFAPDTEVLVLGHTHHPLAYGERSGALLDRRSGSVRFQESERVLVNPGSVGQSRERRAVARYAVLDLGERRVEFRDTPYDGRACRRALRERGLPAHSYHRSPSGPRARLGRLRRRAGSLFSGS